MYNLSGQKLQMNDTFKDIHKKIKFSFALSSGQFFLQVIYIPSNPTDNCTIIPLELLYSVLKTIP